MSQGRLTPGWIAQVAGAEKVLYGLDDVGGAGEIVIVEGEMDKLALEEAGMTNVLSVPDGAPREVCTMKTGAADVVRCQGPAQLCVLIGHTCMRICQSQINCLWKLYISQIDDKDQNMPRREILLGRCGRATCRRRTRTPSMRTCGTAARSWTRPSASCSPPTATARARRASPCRLPTRGMLP